MSRQIHRYQNYLKNQTLKSKDKISMKSATKQRIKTQPVQIKYSDFVENQKVKNIDKVQFFNYEVYHRPKFRQKLFCSIIDSYIQKTQDQNKKGSKSKNLSEYYDQNLTFFKQKAQAQNQLSKSQMGNRARQKRACTAGTIRPQQASICNQKNKIYCQQIFQKAKEQQSQYNAVYRSRIRQKNCNKVTYESESVSQHNLQQQQIIRVNKFFHQSKRKYKRLQSKINETELISRTKKNSIVQSQSDSSINSIAEQQIFMPLKNQKSSGSKVSNQMATQTKLNFQLHQQITEQQASQYLARLKNSQYSKTLWNIISVKKDKLFWTYTLAQRNHKSQMGVQRQNTSKIQLKQFTKNDLAYGMLNIMQKIQIQKVSQVWHKISNQKPIQGQKIIFYSKDTASLRQELFLFAKFQNTEQNRQVVHIKLTRKYEQLFLQNCQQFKDIIVCVCKDLIQMKGRIINNNLTLDNLYRFQQKCIKIKQWSNSAIRKKIIADNKQIFAVDDPILFQQIQNKESIQKKWLVHPQALPPQIIQCLIEGNYAKIWRLEHVPQIWSLGVMIFQILTSIPVWMPEKCYMSHNTPKKGLFYDEQTRLSEILRKQLKMPSIINKWIRKQKNSQTYHRIDHNIIILMRQMLQINPLLRPQPQQVIHRLKKI